MTKRFAVARHFAMPSGGLAAPGARCDATPACRAESIALPARCGLRATFARIDTIIRQLGLGLRPAGRGHARDQAAIAWRDEDELW